MKSVVYLNVLVLSFGVLAVDLGSRPVYAGSVQAESSDAAADTGKKNSKARKRAKQKLRSTESENLPGGDSGAAISPSSPEAGGRDNAGARPAAGSEPGPRGNPGESVTNTPPQTGEDANKPVPPSVGGTPVPASPN